MSHVVHTTRALVVGSVGVHDADKLFWLFTEDFGLIFASAKSVREEASKLRYALQDLSLVRVSLVRGRGLWRITGAEQEKSYELSRSAAEALGRIAMLMRRVTPTDEQYSELFTVVQNAHSALVHTEILPEHIETATVARILYRLGYLSCTREYRGLIDTLHFDDSVLMHIDTVRDALIHDINAGLTESQL